MRKIYIAGPMSGHDQLNHNEFFRIERLLKSHGWNPINPASLDLAAGINPNVPMNEYDYAAAARRDIEALKTCDAIYLMAGWQYSKGACWERAIAVDLGIPCYYEIPREDHS
jgi:nucleoside 2-deoxyribosyltransferase